MFIFEEGKGGEEEKVCMCVCVSASVCECVQETAPRNPQRYSQTSGVTFCEPVCIS